MTSNKQVWGLKSVALKRILKEKERKRKIRSQRKKNDKKELYVEIHRIEKELKKNYICH